MKNLVIPTFSLEGLQAADEVRICADKASIAAKPRRQRPLQMCCLGTSRDFPPRNCHGQKGGRQNHVSCLQKICFHFFGKHSWKESFGGKHNAATTP